MMVSFSFFLSFFFSIVSVTLILTTHAVPVNLKEQDAFHLTIEEYLLALISMVEELVCPSLYALCVYSNY